MNDNSIRKLQRRHEKRLERNAKERKLGHTAEIVDFWRYVVYDELVKSGDPELAAERAGKDLDYIELAYQTDPEFKLTCDECLKEYKEESKLLAFKERQKQLAESYKRLKTEE